MNPDPRQALMSAIAALPRDEQICIVLFVVEQMQAAEIAAVLSSARGRAVSAEEALEMFDVAHSVLHELIDAYRASAAH